MSDLASRLKERLAFKQKRHMGLHEKYSKPSAKALLAEGEK